ncbi:MAG: phage tail sheath protein [Acidobacteriota bacterium]
MTLVIPGVEVRVVKELVPRGLGATGILGIVGQTEIDPGPPLRAVASMQEFLSLYGGASAESLPEVRHAFANGINEVVVVSLSSNDGGPASGEFPIREAPGRLTVRARAAGVFGSQIAVRAIAKEIAGGFLTDIEVFFGDAAQPVEAFRNLGTDSDKADFFAGVINRDSTFIDFPQFLPSSPEPPEDGLMVPLDSQKRALRGGHEASPRAYVEAITELESRPEIDLVTVSAAFSDMGDAKQVYSALISHCDLMSQRAKPRIGFGQIPTHQGRPNVDAAGDMAQTLTSDRFVLTAPHGYLGAVIGRVGGLDYFQSPTFKTLRGVTSLSFDFSDSDLRDLLTNGLLPVDRVPRKGFAMVRGITTDGGQINVTRIADRAVRHVQNIAQDFIGRLNTRAQRLAIKQLIIAAFTRMEQEGALVPSTDGTSPAFEVDVESSQADFAQGIVRIHTAVRPVRAIDFIYATILVQA